MAGLDGCYASCIAFCFLSALFAVLCMHVLYTLPTFRGCCEIAALWEIYGQRERRRRHGLQNSRASSPATRDVHAVCSRSCTMKPNRL